MGAHPAIQLSIVAGSVEEFLEKLSYKLIADKLSISMDMVRDHFKNICRIL